MEKKEPSQKEHEITVQKLMQVVYELPSKLMDFFSRFGKYFFIGLIILVVLLFTISGYDFILLIRSDNGLRVLIGILLFYVLVIFPWMSTAIVDTKDELVKEHNDKSKSLKSLDENIGVIKNKTDLMLHKRIKYLYPECFKSKKISDYLLNVHESLQKIEQDDYRFRNLKNNFIIPHSLKHFSENILYFSTAEETAIGGTLSEYTKKILEAASGYKCDDVIMLTTTYDVDIHSNNELHKQFMRLMEIASEDGLKIRNLIFINHQMLNDSDYKSKVKQFHENRSKGVPIYILERVPGIDNQKLKNYLVKRFDLKWVDDATIEEDKERKTIKISFNEKQVSIRLISDHELALSIDGEPKYKLSVKKEIKNGKELKYAYDSKLLELKYLPIIPEYPDYLYVDYTICCQNRGSLFGKALIIGDFDRTHNEVYTIANFPNEIIQTFKQFFEAEWYNRDAMPFEEVLPD